MIKIGSWVNIFSIYRLTVLEILNELEALDDNEFNGSVIYSIPFQDGSDTE